MMWNLSSMPAGSVGVVTSGRGDTNVIGPPSEMFKQWVLAGPALSVNFDRPSGFHAYLVGTPPFEGRQMLEFADRSYNTLGAWFKYLGLPDYNLLVRAINTPSFGTGTAGEGRGGSLINVGPAYWPGQDDAYFRSTIFHEMTHQWVGLIQGRDSWFEEGLTVFITATLPCEAHLLTPDQCASDLNSALRSYYTSEAKHWSQKRIDDAPFTNEAAREVPYARGALYFANLNSQLLMKSGGARGLKEAIYPQFVARRDGKGLSQEDFEEMLRRELGQKAVAEFRGAMINGEEEIVPPSGAFGPCLARVSVTNVLKDGRTAVRGYEWVPIIDGAPASCKGS
jgi:predicted metalloprotease with PDZ domain